MPQPANRHSEMSLLFADESSDAGDVSERDDEAKSPDERVPWAVLIADDDIEVHRATIFALRGVVIDGRALELLHANDAAEAHEILRSRRDIAVAMLDVVMETPDAGLRLVEVIRNELKYHSIRIVLRTGQPGYAPELEVIQRYDINDYRTKNELTQSRLVTTLTAALRAYQQLELVHAANRGMELMARAANEIFRLRCSTDFSRLLLERIESLLDRPIDGLVCLARSQTALDQSSGLFIEHAIGRYAPKRGCAASQVLDVELQRVIQRCVAAQTCVFEVSRAAMWLGHGGRDAVAVIELNGVLRELENRLLQMFAASLAVGFENVDLIERLDFFAFHDPLTHLPNRVRFLSEVEGDLFSRQGEARSLGMADIVRFSEVNEVLGFRSGDSLLEAVGKRLRGALGAGSIVARLAGDTFGIYGVERAVDPEVIKKAFDAPFFVHGHALHVQLRLGIVHLSQCKGSAVELLRNANLALNYARQFGGAASRVFSTDMSEDARTRVGVLHSLRAAIDFKRGLSVVYQPVVNVVTHQVVAVEALLRWRNDMGVMVSPARFVPLAERADMIHELGGWVLEQAVVQLARWHCIAGLSGLRMSVNVSVAQLRKEPFASEVRGILALSDVDPAHICFEFSEALLVEEPEHVRATLERLRELGIQLLIDGFGGGDASLRQLVRLPVNAVKLAPDYARQIVGAEEEQQIVQAVLMLAQQGGRQVIAKAVEKPEQMDAFLQSGCPCMQGFLFAQPMSPEEFLTWWSSRSSGRV